jgi:tRNA pseudouridine55 synthase
MAKRRARGRDISGVLLLDKPKGPTSNAVLQQVKHLFFAQKAGHTGSLDPIATGLLPICFGKATRLSMFLLEADKSYRVTAKLGVTTTTADCEGEVLEERPVPTLTSDRIEESLARYTGKILQTPPMHSAVKVAGKPLYKYAHAGEEIAREARPVTIYQLNLVEQVSETELVLDVFCSKGTYIRTLVEDIGNDLGCGAHVTALSRTGLAEFTLADSISLEKLESLKDLDDGFVALNAHVHPSDYMLRFLSALELDVNEHYYLRHGQPIRIASAPKSGLVRLYAADAFVGVGQILDDGRVAPKRLM